MADLTELFARLKSPNVQSPPSESPHHHQPSVSSPIFSPSRSGPHPHHESAVLSPNTSAMNTPAPEAGNSDRTTSLLNLLRFNQPQQQASARQSSISSDNRPPSSAAPAVQSDSPSASARPVSASDLVAAFMKKQSSSSMAMHSPAVASSGSGRAEPQHTPSAENPQDLLLKLLNHPKSSAASEAGSIRHLDTNKSPASLAKSPVASIPDLTEQFSATRLESNVQAPTSNVPDFGNGSSGHSFGLNASAAPSGSIFTYANPFDQLERSSPLKRTGKPETPRTSLPKVDILKHERDPSSNYGDGQGSAPSPKHRKLSPEKIFGSETVSKAVTEVGQQVEKELEEVLAEADVKHEENVSKDNAQASLAKEAEGIAREAAKEIKHELKDPETREVLEAALDGPAVEALEEVAEDLAPDNIADSWESADAEDSPAQSEGDVKVFNFPMRPFTSIEVMSLQDKPPTFRSSIIMAIAKTKKDFDQMDRQLVCASKNFIVYATLKPLGFRVIRQESGQYRQVFEKPEERIFNITMCASSTGSSPADSETVLGTGVNGSIFWTMVQTGNAEPLSDEDLDQAGFVFPPAPVHDDNTSGGQLKTRAKTSTRHPEFFAVGRGKSIHLVYPKVAGSDRYTDKTRICDSEKYLKERSLKIVTGKAGKDFAFSADDSVIVSLDKAGKMRFWDIRSFWDADDANPTGSFEPQTIRAPLWTLQTTSPSEKSWPTSVFFLDKERPVTKGIALRYLVVGQKQNHTLQLWDLGLGKAVQELNLPHDNESDAICTVAYHAKTGVMVVGHPTRNSIYFIHISAPKYTLAAMSQAKYIGNLADPKSGLGKPESTAIMSGIREYSLGSKGKLRTLHLLDEHVSAPESFGPGDAPVFELYVVHSKGVSLISIFREDLGWTKDYRVRNPVDAAGTGAVTVNTLRPPQPVTEGSTNGEPRSAPSTQGTTRDVSKKDSAITSRTAQTPEAAIRASTLAKVESKQEAERAAIINGSDKTEKKKKKRAADTASQVSNAPSRAQSSQPSSSLPTTSTPSYAQAAQLPSSPAPPSLSMVSQSKTTDADVPEWAVKILSQSQQSSTPPAVDEAVVKRLAKNVTSDVTQALTDSLGGLYKRIDDDKRALDASSSAKQEAVLRLVSSTLSDNLDQAFKRHVKEAVGTSILPALNNTVSSSLSTHVARTLQQTTADVVSREFKTSLPNLISKAVQEPDTLRIISDLVSNKVAKSVEGQVSASIKSLGPDLSKIAVNAAQQVALQIDHHIADQFRQSEMQRQADAVKIDQLTKLVQSLAESVHAMSAAQSELKEEIVRLQRTPEGSAQAQSPSKREAPRAEAPKADPELEAIRQLITDGAYEDGTIMWLQSSRQPELFDLLFVRCSPAFIQHLSPLVALSVGAAATASLETFLSERLIWLEQVLMTIDAKDAEIVEVVPQIMDVLTTRLHSVYMQANEVEGTNPQVLKRISSLARKTAELKREAQQYFHGIPGERG